MAEPSSAFDRVNEGLWVMPSLRLHHADVTRALALLLAPAVIAATAGCARHSPESSENSVFGITLNPNALPSWARALGRGVVVVAPTRTAPGHDSPGAVVMGFNVAADSHRLVRACPYFPPGFQTQCEAEFDSPSPPTIGGVQKNFRLGYVVIDGDKALVATSETVCAVGQTPECSSEAALFPRGKTFAALWNETISELSGPKKDDGLYPCVLVGGRWYLYGPV